LSVHADPLVTERWRLTFCRLLGSPRLKDGIDASQPANRSTVRSWSARPAHCERPHGVADDRWARSRAYAGASLIARLTACG